MRAFAREMDMTGAHIAATQCVVADAEQVFTGVFYGGDALRH